MQTLPSGDVAPANSSTRKSEVELPKTDAHADEWGIGFGGGKAVTGCLVKAYWGNMVF